MKLGVAAGLFVWVTLQPWIITAQEPLTGRPVRVALIGFQPEVADLSVAELSKDSELLLVERAELERILGELALSSSQNLKPADALRLGKMLGADWLLLGQILSLQGTNHLLARIADARTGIIRDLAMFPATPSNYLASAKAVADFLRSSRRAVTNLSERQFVALGAFTDLSVSKRYRDFGDQFRAWLTERFRTSSVAVVERSATEMLLTELRMSQAGFSEPRTNYTEAMPAVLIADGIYQSFQDTNSKLNIVLRLQRMGERARTIAFNEPPGPALNGKLAGAIEKALAESGT
ncbi:MAG TPA: CsgG/HfaB family protein, partial [Candidatus Binatia bacterium]|nr:CsgG/HfaB family protein [Candidatus Binatia bacterium]